ncbi:MAG: hypothetical protein LBT40_10305 [Deltaproteobacteria bacterium]|jgi:hypothetical protein|nr:hypothetical protein [Deltaproteobacteria bacterium]
MRLMIQLAAAVAATALLLGALSQTAAAQEAGASPSEPPPAAAADAQAAPAVTPDAGSPPAGTPDAGSPPAGTPDAGSPPVGTADAGSPPAGTPDRGKSHVWWAKTYGGTGFDQFDSVSATSDGGLIAAGRSSSSDGDAEGNRGLTDAWILKLDKDGAVQWKRSLGGSGVDWAGAVREVPFGGYLVAGGTTITDGDFEGEGDDDGNLKAWAASLDEGGNTRWVKILLPGKAWAAADMTVQSGEGIIVTGSARVAPGGDDCGTGQGGTIMRSVRISQDGEVSEAGCRRLDPGPEWPAVTSGIDGKSYVGWVAYMLDSPNMDEKASIEAAGPDGKLLWTLPLEGPDNRGSMVPAGLTAASDGLLATGSFLLVGPQARLMFPWLSLIGPDGKPRWDAILGELPQGRLNRATEAPGSLFAAGGTRRGGDMDEGTVNLLAVAVDSGTGKVIWSASLGGSGDDLAESVTTLMDGGLVAAGRTDSTDWDLAERGKDAESGPAENDEKPADTDGWIVKFRP